MSLRFEQYRSSLLDSALRLAQGLDYPVPLRPICRQLKVHGIRRERLESAKSVLIDARVRPVIILNTSLSSTNSPKARFNGLERFVIAHELGHLVLHQSGGKTPSGTSEYWKIERLCDEFARKLLIPDKPVRELVAETELSALDLLRASLFLSKRCAVPWSAAAHRLSEIRKEVIFFRLEPMSTSGFKIVVSTLVDDRGIGKHIKPGTALCEALSGQHLRNRLVNDLASTKLSGIAGITNIASGAVYPSPRGLHLAVLQS
jgi:hypothetical protein